MAYDRPIMSESKIEEYKVQKQKELQEAEDNKNAIFYRLGIYEKEKRDNSSTK